ncbi:MAG: hypothetical protein GVY36_08195 [Verrucomicrobia bacterium]|nr:hypothetical protein [Verrucomicrobiota bacterium]
MAVLGAPLQAQRVEIEHEGRVYVDIATAGGRLGMSAYWLRGYRTFRLRSQWTTIDVGKGERILYLNRMPIYLGFPTHEAGNRLYLARADYQHVLQAILTPQVFSGKPNFRRIVLDPGHGGKDPGAQNAAYGLNEKDLALDVALRLRRLLEESGFEVIMTRESDVYIPLERRPRIANRARGDLFVSIHFNAVASAQPEGLETYAFTPRFQASSKFAKPNWKDNRSYPGNANDPWNALLGYHLQRAMVQQTGGVDRGLKRARWSVLRPLECPGVLVELGFVSHPGTAQKLRTAVYRQTLAQSLYDGIIQYGNRLQRIP